MTDRIHPVPMPQEILQLLENPAALVVVLLAGAFIGALVEQALQWDRRRRRTGIGHADDKRVPPKPSVWSRPGSWTAVGDPVEQLRIVMKASFTMQPLLNRSETRVFKELDQLVIGRNPEWQVMAQVSMGEILKSADAAAYRCINSKRVDLLLVDEECRPRHALEYQGLGHHQGSAAARDAVKKEALRKAGIGYHEIVGGHTRPSDLKRLVDRLVDLPALSPRYVGPTSSTTTPSAISPAGDVTAA